MKICILTITPEFFDSFLKSHAVTRAVHKAGLTVEIVDIREFAPGSFRRIDDSPFGGGRGLMMRCQPVLDALRHVRGEHVREAPANEKLATEALATEVPATEVLATDAIGAEALDTEALSTEAHIRGNEDPVKIHSKTLTAALTPAGIPFTQKRAHLYASMDHLILIYTK